MVAGSNAARCMPFDDRESSGLGHDHRRDQALRLSREAVEIESDQRITGADALALALQHFEAGAGQSNGVDADVQQDVGAIRSAQCHGMRRRGNRHDFAGAGCEQDSGRRIDREAVAHHAAREYLVRHLVERHAPPSERRQEHEVVRSVTHRARSTGWPRSGRSPAVRNVGRGHDGRQAPACAPAAAPRRRRRRRPPPAG